MSRDREAPIAHGSLRALAEVLESGSVRIELHTADGRVASLGVAASALLGRVLAASARRSVLAYSNKP